MCACVCVLVGGWLSQHLDLCTHRQVYLYVCKYIHIHIKNAVVVLSASECGKLPHNS